jgi:putative serine protease PepD
VVDTQSKLGEQRWTSFARRLSSHAAAACLGVLLGANGLWSPVRPKLDERAPMAGHVTPDGQASGDELSAPMPLLAEPPLPVMHASLPPRDIAERARAFTVFVQAGDYYGSGIVATDRGHVLTCLHVVEDIADVRVTFADGSQQAATVVARDPKLDLALLKVGSSAAFMKPGNAGTVRAGDDVFAMGAPRKMAFTLSRGMVSFPDREMNGVGYLQLDLALNGGSSGGPILNELGEVIAISSFILRDSQGLSFALPIQRALDRFAAELGPPKG